MKVFIHISTVYSIERAQSITGKRNHYEKIIITIPSTLVVWGCRWEVRARKSYDEGYKNNEKRRKKESERATLMNIHVNVMSSNR